MYSVNSSPTSCFKNVQVFSFPVRSALWYSWSVFCLHFPVCFRHVHFRITSIDQLKEIDMHISVDFLHLERICCLVFMSQIRSPVRSITASSTPQKHIYFSKWPIYPSETIYISVMFTDLLDLKKLTNHSLTSNIV